MPHGMAIVAAVAIVAVIGISGFYVATFRGDIASQPNDLATDNTMSRSNNGHNAISVSGLSLCASNCDYPSPYVSATILINATVPISTVAVYVNDTYDGLPIQNPGTTTFTCTSSGNQTCSFELGGSRYSNSTFTTSTKYYVTCFVPPDSGSCSATDTGSLNNSTLFAYSYKGGVPNSFMPIVPGDTYLFTFVATFQDGSTATATESTVAS
jgi:hypothetical protein